MASITGLETSSTHSHLLDVGVSVALALLTKWTHRSVFFAGAAIPYLLLTGQWRRWRQLKPVTGFLLFLFAIAAPWHILLRPCQSSTVSGAPRRQSPRPSATFTGSFTSISSTRHFLRLFLAALPSRLQQAALRRHCWLLHTLCGSSRGALFLPALVAVAWKTRRISLGSARPPRCRPDIGFLPR